MKGIEARLLDVVLELSHCRDIEQVTRVLRVAARDLTGADGVTVVLRDGDLCHYVDESSISPLWKGRRFAMRTCISGWCMMNREQVAIPDIYLDDRIPHDAYRPTFVKSLAMTPIRSADPIGAIGAYWASHHVATPAELATLQSLGDAAAIAMDNARLIQAIEDADKRKEQFLSMLAHELRNPLGPIRNGLHVLIAESEGMGSDRVRRASEMMDRQLRHMTQIVDDLLDVSRLIRGHIALDRHRFDLAKVVREALEDWKGVLTGSGISLTGHAMSTPVWVFGDAMRITQVLANVLENASKFTPRGGAVAVNIERDEATSMVTVRVMDTGVGIDPVVLPFIFDPLEQGDRSLDRQGGGLGLGLSVAKGLVELHGGTIAVSSDGVGRGTTVAIAFPLQPELPAIEEGPADKTPIAALERVLLVEDNRDAADTLRMILEYWGYQVGVAYTGTDGVEKAISTEPEIVICDIGLPGMDGYEVARALRGNERTVKARLIALTGYGGEENREAALSAGFDLHLVKPVRPEVLRERLKSA